MLRDVSVIGIDGVRCVGVGVSDCDVQVHDDGSGIEIEGEIERHSCEVDKVDEGIKGEIEKHSDEVQHEYDNEDCKEMLEDGLGSSSTKSIA